MPASVLLWHSIDHKRIDDEIGVLVSTFRREILGDELLAKYRVVNERIPRQLPGILSELADNWVSRAYSICCDVWKQPESDDFMASAWKYCIEEFIKDHVETLLCLGFDVNPHDGRATSSEKKGKARNIREGLEHHWRQKLGNPASYRAAVQALVDFERRTGNPAFQSVPPSPQPVTELAAPNPINIQPPATPLPICPQAADVPDLVNSRAEEAVEQLQSIPLDELECANEQTGEITTDSAAHGSDDLVSKESSSAAPAVAPEEIVTSAKGRRKLPPKRNDLSNYLDQARLTDRQRECISLKLEYGLTVSAIAERLGISRKTVDEHLYAAERRISAARIKDKGAANKARFNPER